MAPVVIDSPAPVPQPELTILEAHLPYSYSLLRRAQFTHRPQGTTEHAHYLFASDPESPFGFRRGPLSTTKVTDTTTHPVVVGKRGHFAAAYVDLSSGPETAVFLYSTLQDADDTTTSLPNEEIEHVLDLIVALLRRIREIAAATRTAGSYTLYRDHGAMVGGLHEATYRLLLERRGITSSYWNPHDVWLFRLDRLPSVSLSGISTNEEDKGTLLLLPRSLQGGGDDYDNNKVIPLRWDVVKREDVPLIASRTKIPKVEATLMSEPSVVLRNTNGELVAWGFMGIAGTLSTLHVEVGLMRILSLSLSLF